MKWGAPGRAAVLRAAAALPVRAMDTGRREPPYRAAPLTVPRIGAKAM